VGFKKQMEQIKQIVFGEEKTVQTQTQQAVKASSKTLAEYARRGAEDICNELAALQFTNFNNKIPEEKMITYRQTIKLLRNKLENAPAMALDTREIDANICKIIPLFQEAISNGYEKTASDICKLLFAAVTEERADIHTFDEVEKEWQLLQRSRKLEKQLVMLQYCLKVDELKNNVAQVDEKIESGKVEYTKAQQELQTEVNEHPELVNRLAEIALLTPDDPDIGDLLIMDAARKRVVTIYNGIERAKAIKAAKQQKIEAIVANIDVLEDQILHSADMLNPQLIKQQEQFSKQYEEMLRQEKRDNAALNDIVDSFNAGLTTYLTDQKVVAEVIKTNLAFNKIMQEQKKREEGRRIAQEELQKQKQAQTQPATHQTHMN